MSVKFDLSGIARIDECRSEVFQAIEDELLGEYKQRGYRFRRWDEDRGSSHGASTSSGTLYRRYYLLVAPEKGKGFQFAILEAKHRSYGKNTTFTWDFAVEPGGQSAVKLYRSLRYVVPGLGAVIGFAAHRFSGLANDDNWLWWALVGGFIGFVIYVPLMRLYWKIYGSVSSSPSPGGTEQSLTIFQSQAEPIVKRVIEKWKEKDILHFPEKIAEGSYEAIDLDDPENMAKIAYEMARDQEGTMMKYGLAVPERQKKYFKNMKLLKEQTEFYEQYREAYNRLKRERHEG